MPDAHDDPHEVRRQARPGEGSRSERQDVRPPPAVGEPVAVALEFLAPAEHLMAREHRLGPAQVRVARDHEPLLAHREAEERALEFEQARVEPVDRPPAVEPEVGGHLVVAAAGRMQLAADVTEPGRQGRLDVEMDVFLRGGELEQAPVDLAPNLLEPPGDRIGLRHRDEAAGGKHPRVGDRGVDVVVGEPFVERHAFRKRLDPLVGRLAKHAAPCF